MASSGMMVRFRLPLLLLLVSLAGCRSVPPAAVPKTTFQTHQPWKPGIDIRADAVMCYGAEGLEDRVASWAEKGYRTDFMTGIAWGGYQDYFTGAWDGVPHWDEGQVQMEGDTLWHGRNVPYIVPTENYLAYFKETQVKRAIDAGADALYLEEPEFWNRGGYSDAFKREWEAFYGTPWQPQDASPEATYLANKLKYHLYYRALEEAFTYAKAYGASLGRDIRCYVPTHSLVNYSMWEIVSPEASLASLPCVDGYIAQVWTGTSRVPNYYDGLLKERVFETAFLEYGCMASMTAPTGRDLWFLTDPIEDRVRDWEDYRRNYQATFTAQLLYPQVADYEVMPWPARIYEHLYPVRPGSEERSRIPKDYATMMGVMVNALQRMPSVPARTGGSQGLSVLMGNSLMFQRFPVHEGYTDPQLSGFFGLALPLLKSGVPVGITHIENLPGALRDVRVLLMTYSNMKPLDPAAHEALSEWVRSGGCLLYAGRDDDPFQRVPEWWNTGENAFDAPSGHLFGMLGLGTDPAEGTYAVGKGMVQVLRTDPKDFALQEGGAERLLKVVEGLYGPLQRKNYLRLSRGPYEVAAVMDESGDAEPLHLDGLYLDLYDPALPVYDGMDIRPGTQKLLYDLSRRPKGPSILAEAGRSQEVVATRKSFSFISLGPAETQNRMRISLPKEPVSVEVDGTAPQWTWDETSRTLLLAFDNDPDGVRVTVRF